jgi:predicted nucleic acid-binding protein
MKFVIDTNTVFSAILNPNSNIGQILLNGSKYFTFLSIDQLKDEIDSHTDKILKISGLNMSEFKRIYGLINTKIRFVHHLLISDQNYKKAEKLTFDIDPDDLLFVGLSLQFSCKLWTGDKQLIKGLRSKGFDLIITTREIFEIYLEKESNRRQIFK